MQANINQVINKTKQATFPSVDKYFHFYFASTKNIHSFANTFVSDKHTFYK